MRGSSYTYLGLMSLIQVALTACASTQAPPLITSAIWRGSYLTAGDSVAASDRVPFCPLTAMLSEAQSWEGRQPPPERYGNSSLDFIRALMPKACQQALVAKKPMARQLGIGSLVILGNEKSKVAALVESCERDGTCYLLARLPSGVKRLTMNLSRPHLHRDATGKVINSIMRLLDEKGDSVILTSALSLTSLWENKAAQVVLKEGTDLAMGAAEQLE